MNVEEEKELNDRIEALSDMATRAMNQRNDYECKLRKAEATAKLFKSHTKTLVAVNVIMLVAFAVKVIFLTPDPVVCEGEEKAWDKYLVELNACWDEQEFLDYANRFGFCDPRPMEMYMRSCEAAWEINKDFNEYIKDCEEDLRKCNVELDRVSKDLASQYNLNELMRHKGSK